jgi:hypothetical protein
MTGAAPKKGAKVLPMKPAAAQKKQSEMKWGAEVMKLGYCILPSILLQAQARLCISPQQMIVLLQLAEHWWREDSKVFPAKAALASRVGLSEKQIQRHIAVLEQKKLVKRIERILPGRGKVSNEYDLSGLVRKLKEIAPEFEEAKKMKAAAAKPGGIKAAKAATTA